jgi:hypothetical protein
VLICSGLVYRGCSAHGAKQDYERGNRGQSESLLESAETLLRVYGGEVPLNPSSKLSLLEISELDLY